MRNGHSSALLSEHFSSISKPLMKPLVLVNASAGTAAAFAGEDLCARIERAFAAAGRPSDVHPITPRKLEHALDQAAAEARPVIVGGGDGSVSAAVQRFAGTGIPLGVLPFGTYNLLAQDLGMSSDVEEAVRQLAAAERAPHRPRPGRASPLSHARRPRIFLAVARQRARFANRSRSELVGAALAAYAGSAAAAISTSRSTTARAAKASGPPPSSSP